jgi:prefoldin subunit 1
MTQPDPELKKAFEDLQAKMIYSRNQMKIIQVQSDNLKRQIQHSKLTEKEIGQLTEDVRMFEGIGRMFVLCNKPIILNNLDNKMKSCEEKMSNLEKTKEYLEKSLKDSENSLRELISIKQGKK